MRVYRQRLSDATVRQVVGSRQDSAETGEKLVSMIVALTRAYLHR